MAIFMHKIDHFCLQFPEALINLVKRGAKATTTWFLFEVNIVEVMIICISSKI